MMSAAPTILPATLRVSKNQPAKKGRGLRLRANGQI